MGALCCSSCSGNVTYSSSCSGSNKYIAVVAVDSSDCSGSNM